MKWIIHGSGENPKQHMFDITTTGYQSQNIKTFFVCYLPIQVSLVLEFELMQIDFLSSRIWQKEFLWENKAS